MSSVLRGIQKSGERCAVYWLEELIIGFQDLCPASFHTMFHKNCGRGEGLSIATCLTAVVWGKRGNAPPCMILLLLKLSYLSFEFHEDHKIVTKLW